MQAEPIPLSKSGTRKRGGIKNRQRTPNPDGATKRVVFADEVGLDLVREKTPRKIKVRQYKLAVQDRPIASEDGSLSDSAIETTPRSPRPSLKKSHKLPEKLLKSASAVASDTPLDATSVSALHDVNLSPPLRGKSLVVQPFSFATEARALRKRSSSVEAERTIIVRPRRLAHPSKRLASLTTKEGSGLTLDGDTNKIPLMNNLPPPLVVPAPMSTKHTTTLPPFNSKHQQSGPSLGPPPILSFASSQNAANSAFKAPKGLSSTPPPSSSTTSTPPSVVDSVKIEKERPRLPSANGKPQSTNQPPPVVTPSMKQPPPLTSQQTLPFRTTNIDSHNSTSGATQTLHSRVVPPAPISSSASAQTSTSSTTKDLPSPRTGGFTSPMRLPAEPTATTNTTTTSAISRQTQSIKEQHQVVTASMPPSHSAKKVATSTSMQQANASGKGPNQTATISASSRVRAAQIAVSTAVSTAGKQQVQQRMSSPPPTSAGGKTGGSITVIQPLESGVTAAASPSPIVEHSPVSSPKSFSSTTSNQNHAEIPTGESKMQPTAAAAASAVSYPNWAPPPPIPSASVVLPPPTATTTYSLTNSIFSLGSAAPTGPMSMMMGSSQPTSVSGTTPISSAPPSDRGGGGGADKPRGLASALASVSLLSNFTFKTELDGPALKSTLGGAKSRSIFSSATPEEDESPRPRPSGPSGPLVRVVFVPASMKEDVVERMTWTGQHVMDFERWIGGKFRCRSWVPEGYEGTTPEERCMCCMRFQVQGLEENTRAQKIFPALPIHGDAVFCSYVVDAHLREYRLVSLSSDVLLARKPPPAQHVGGTSALDWTTNDPAGWRGSPPPPAASDPPGNMFSATASHHHGVDGGTHMLSDGDSSLKHGRDSPFPPSASKVRTGFVPPPGIIARPRASILDQ